MFSRTLALGLPIVIVCLAACGGTAITAGSGGSGSGGSSASGHDATGAGGAGGAAQCGAAFPTFDKTCASPADCVMKIHVLDCCGSAMAIGVSAAESAAFDAAEARCDAMFPGCACPQAPLRAEDGKTTPDKNAIQLLCQMKACSTAVP